MGPSAHWIPLTRSSVTTNTDISVVRKFLSLTPMLQKFGYNELNSGNVTARCTRNPVHLVLVPVNGGFHSV